MNILEVEMCNIIVDRSNLSTESCNALNFICFYLYSGERSQLEKYPYKPNYSQEKSSCMLCLFSSKFSKFDQVVRASENTILSMDSCFIELCTGKSIVMLNPLILKLINTKFEYNRNDCIHIKYSYNLKAFYDVKALELSHINIKNDEKENKFTFHNPSIFYKNNNIFISKNTFYKNSANGIIIEGSEHDNYVEKLLDSTNISTSSRRTICLIHLTCSNNVFHKNKFNGIHIKEVINSKILIEGNDFNNNEENGVYINNVNFNNNFNIYNSYNYFNNKFNNNPNHADIMVRMNKFIENLGFGLFIHNFIIVKIIENDFVKNKFGGIIICNLDLADKALLGNEYNLSQDANLNNCNNKNSNLTITKTTIMNNESSSPNKNINNGNNNKQLNYNNNLNLNNLNNFQNRIQEKDKNNDHFSNKIEFYNKMFSGKTTFLFKNNFIKNSGSGIKLINYNYLVIVSQCNISENVEYGIYSENTTNSKMNEKSIDNFNKFSYNLSDVKKLVNYFEEKTNIKFSDFIKQNTSIKDSDSNTNSTKSQSYFSKMIENINALNTSNNNINSNEYIKNCYYSFIEEHVEQFPIESNLIIHKSTIDSNLRSGIYLNNQLIYLLSSVISDNINYALELKEECQKANLKSNSTLSNSLAGKIGGDWGEIQISSSFSCSCLSRKLNKSTKNFNLNLGLEKKNSFSFQQSSLIFNEKIKAELNSRDGKCLSDYASKDKSNNFNKSCLNKNIDRKNIDNKDSITISKINTNNVVNKDNDKEEYNPTMQETTAKNCLIF